MIYGLQQWTFIKVLSLILLVMAPELAHGQSVDPASACGAKGANFDVATESVPHSATVHDQSKAQVYFIQDNGPDGDKQHFTLKIGLDGQWVGAYKENSYFMVSLVPGEHHVCANIQSDTSTGRIIALAHFTAEAGKVYYFRTTFLSGMTSLYPIPPHLDLDQPDSDQGKFLISVYPISSSHLRK